MTIVTLCDQSTIVVKGVPAEICSNCREHFLSEEVAQRVSDPGDIAVQDGTEVTIRNRAAQLRIRHPA